MRSGVAPSAPCLAVIEQQPKSTLLLALGGENGVERATGPPLVLGISMVRHVMLALMLTLIWVCLISPRPSQAASPQPPAVPTPPSKLAARAPTSPRTPPLTNSVSCCTSFLFPTLLRCMILLALRVPSSPRSPRALARSRTMAGGLWRCTWRRPVLRSRGRFFNATIQPLAEL